MRQGVRLESIKQMHRRRMALLQVTRRGGAELAKKSPTSVKKL